MMWGILRVSTSFNPRICKRCDYADDVPDPDKNVSIHASVKDATRAFLRASGLISFNPRICKRCDKANALATRAIMVSIHASVKDATSCCTPIRVVDYVSIHASVKDATNVIRLLPSLLVFQSTHL